MGRGDSGLNGLTSLGEFAGGKLAPGLVEVRVAVRGIDGDGAVVEVDGLRVIAEFGVFLGDAVEHEGVAFVERQELEEFGESVGHGQRIWAKGVRAHGRRGRAYAQRDDRVMCARRGCGEPRRGVRAMSIEHGVKTIGILGAGQMGGGIAQVAAASGISVKVFDAFPGAIDRCKGVHKKSMGKFVEKGKMTQADMDAAIGRISFTDRLDGLTGCDWIVEAVVEDAKVKKELFAKLAAMYPDHNVVLATNTSSISITDIATACGASASRVVGMHFFNPVPLMQLVEVIPAMQTSPAVVERTVALATAMGKTPL
jgi:hypothetical protein